MTDQKTDAPATEPTQDAADSTTGERSTKAFWMKVGIGSAAVAAALLYTKRPRSKRRT